MKNQKRFVNPYNFSRPVRKKELFAGRKEELGEISYYLDLASQKNPEFINIAIFGERAIGKSSLLNIIELNAAEKGFLVVRISLDNKMVENDVVFFKELLDCLLTRGAERNLYGGLGGKLYNSFRKMVDFLDASIQIPLLFGTVYIGTKTKTGEAYAPQHVLLHDFEEICQEAKKKGMKAILIMIDECDILANNETIIQKLKNLFERLEGYVLILSGTERMFPALDKTFSPAPRMFKKIHLDRFAYEQEVLDCIIRPLSINEKGKFDILSFQDIYELSGGNPYEINLICHFMYKEFKEKNQEEMTLSSSALKSAFNELKISQEPERSKLIEEISKCEIKELALLRLILSMEDNTLEKLAIADLMDNDESLTKTKIKERMKEISKILSNLIDRGAINQKQLRYSFTGSYFDNIYLKYFLISKNMSPPSRSNFFHKVVQKILTFAPPNKDEPLVRRTVMLPPDVPLKKSLDERLKETILPSDIATFIMGTAEKIIFSENNKVYGTLVKFSSTYGPFAVAFDCKSDEDKRYLKKFLLKKTISYFNPIKIKIAETLDYEKSILSAHDWWKKIKSDEKLIKIIQKDDFELVLKILTKIGKKLLTKKGKKRPVFVRVGLR